MLISGINFSVLNFNRTGGNIFISMPRYATSRGDEDYKDVCNPITKQFREELYSTILDAFDSLESSEHTKVSVAKDEKKELFVAMPSYKVKQADESGKSGYQDIMYPITRTFWEKLYGAVMDAYGLAKEEQQKQQTSEKPEKKGKSAGKDGEWLESLAGEEPFR